MAQRIYTPSNLGFGQSAAPFPNIQVQIGSGRGLGRGFRTFGPMSGGGGYGDGGGAVAPASSTGPAPVPPHLRINFDTIGQTIVESIGHCRLPLRPIWAEGIVESGDETVSPTQTFAGALCAPIDPDEDGDIFSIWDSDKLVYNSGSVVSPLGWSDADVALLAASLSAITIYPGDEAQLPDSRIVADKGTARTNAFRGLRYVIVPFYPIFGGGSGSGSSAGGLPSLSVGFRRSTDGGEPEESSDAIEFAPGST